MENKILSTLCDLGISTEESINQFYPKVRDRDDISVLKCNKSGVIFLSRSDHMDISHYEEKEDFEYWKGKERQAGLDFCRDDDLRRASQFKNMITGKKWLDVGTGAGGILDLIASESSKLVAIEPQKHTRKELIELGYEVFSSIDVMPYNDFEVVTLFHVLEHITNSIETLKLIREKMSKNSKIIIEVPHANDLLISFFDIDEFKNFTFWSQHLILHTKESLKTYLEEAGFSDIVIEGYQRYPMANHFHWLAKNKPGGHKIWKELRSDELDNSYSKVLSKMNCNDTLIAIATKK